MCQNLRLGNKDAPIQICRCKSKIGKVERNGKARPNSHLERFLGGKEEGKNDANIGIVCRKYCEKATRSRQDH
jgi:hypothetical protein